MQTVYKNSRSAFCRCLEEGAEDFSLQDAIHKLTFAVKITRNKIVKYKLLTVGG